jgi:hypothetical protein
VSPGVYERPPLSDLRGRYVAFADPSGGSSDSFALAIAHAEGPTAIVDCAREIKAPFDPGFVVEEFAGVLRSYWLSSVRGDRYAGEWPVAAYRKAGIWYRAAEVPKSQIYLEALPLLNGRRVELPDNARLVGQICALERRTARGGRDSVDHPPMGHDDLANAALGAAWMVSGKVRAGLTQARLLGI